MNNREMLEKANNLRRNGQNELADSFYDQLLISEPNNDEFVFCKAMNLVKSNPSKSIELFKKVLEINPNENASFGNIASIAIKNNLFEEAIPIFNKYIQKNPNNLDLIYQRGTLIGNNGNYLQALIDFYHVLDNSTLKDNPEQFLQHQISTDIALCKTKLRSETMNKPMPDLGIGIKYDSVQFKKYQYPLPANLFGDENFIMEFGKMMGNSIKEIIDKQPDYLSWCILNLDIFCVSEEIIEIIKRKGIDVSESEKVNLFKLKLLDETEPSIKFNGDTPPDSFTIDNDGNIIY